MTYMDPFGRRYRASQPGRQNSNPYQPGARSGNVQPTLEDYHQLSEAYQLLLKKMEETQAQLDATQEALRQQVKSAMDFQDHLKVANQALAEVSQERDEALALAAASQEELTLLKVETANYRTRLEQRLEREADEKRLALLRDTLTLGDHLELAIVYWEQQAGPDGDGGFRSNLVATRNAFLETLRRHGVQPQQPIGDEFNPELHEAVGQIPSQEVPLDRVAHVVQTGYTLGDQLLRPARVMISSGAAVEGV
jgi:molecular chaperone GrpE